ncbi:MAG: sensor histidine kinase, partial [Polymorphobacter sp.]
LAHELSQPLTAIANYMEGALDLVDRTDPDARALVREAMAEAAAQSLRAGQIVKRLRDFIARGSNERAIESLSRLVSEASALALTGIGKGNVDVEVRLDPAGDAVLVDRIQIQQVLLNLIRNAVEAMQRSPRRRLAIRARAVSGAMVEVSVSDSGPGIDTQMLTHLFEPFQSNKEQGMGLGLSISRTIIEAHGGRLWTDVSDLGGAAFHFTVQAAGNAETGHG